jgi:hypothetical protein
MSLINEALKKAQNRQGESQPSTPAAGGPAAIPGSPRQRKSSLTQPLLIGTGIAVLCIGVSVTITFFLLRKDDPAPTPPPTPVVVQPAPALPAPPVAISPTPAPIAAPPVTGGETTANTPTLIVAPPTVVATPVAPPPVEPAPVIKIGTRIQSFVDRLRVTSIRISDTGNKAILNDRLFRVNDLVEPTLGLRLTDIQPHVLTFTDETGATYLRHF